MPTIVDHRTAGELLGASYHEASHAVVGTLFRCEVEFATIEIDEVANNWGQVRCRPPLDPIRAIALLSCGFTGEYRAARRFVSIGKDSKDFRDIANVLSAAIPAEDQTQREPVYRRGILLGRKMVCQNWPAIKHVARRLRTTTTISGREIRQIVQKHRRISHAM